MRCRVGAGGLDRAGAGGLDRAGAGGLDRGAEPGRASPAAANRSLTVVFAPDSFKGSLSSVEVAQALADGWTRARPDDTLVLAPLADGGQGTLDAIAAAGGWTWQEAVASDPLGRPLVARWLRSSDGGRAAVELAEASGLFRAAPPDRDPLRAATFGTGQVLRAVLDTGVRDIVLGIGGSATTDGGSGLLRALGARLIDRTGSPAPPGGGGLTALGRIDLTGLDRRLAEVTMRIACDVTNPLLGSGGAAATYGPQKGATPSQVAELDRALEHWAELLERVTARHERGTPGAGAAGGTAFGLLCLRDRFRALELVPGVDLVADATDLAGKLTLADVVVTGEGRIDAQTAFGKTALGVARRAAELGIRCLAVGGGVEPEGVAALAALGTEVIPVHAQPIPLDEAIAAGAAPLVACGERLARGMALRD